MNIDETTKYQLLAQQLETLNHYATLTITSILTFNGGACIALLNYLKDHQPQNNLASKALLSFALASIFALFTTISAYLTQHHNFHADKLELTKATKENNHYNLSELWRIRTLKLISITLLIDILAIVLIYISLI